MGEYKIIYGSLEHAIQIATKAHKGQVDKAGCDYIYHPMRVMNSVEGENEKIVAILHDTVEDTNITLLYLREVGFSDIIIEAIDSLTKRRGDSKETSALRAAQNKIGQKVKLADLKDNMDLSRLSVITGKDLERQKKYERAYQIILSEIEQQENEM